MCLAPARGCRGDMANRTGRLVLVLQFLHLTSLSALSDPHANALRNSVQQPQVPVLRGQGLRLVVRGIDSSSTDADGPVGKIFVAQTGADKHKCTQEQLDTMISQGFRPDLEFENSDLASRFFELREKNTQIELYLDERRRSNTNEQVAGKRKATEVEREGTFDAHQGDSARSPVVAEMRRLGIETDDPFLQSYASLSVHETMIKDKIRTAWFWREIEQNKHLFKDAVVLDVGAGTGILSMFAVRAGARKVYAVESSDIASLAQRLVDNNGFNKTVSVLQADVETVQLPEKVDIIVSEWMGFYLFHESMLASVLSARDRHLKPGGHILPAAARLWAAPVCLSSVWDDKISFWRDPDRTFGLDFSAAAATAQQQFALSPRIDTVEPSALLAEGRVVWEGNVGSLAPKDVEVLQARLEFEVPEGSRVHGLCLWFDVQGLLPGGERLSTAPGRAATHWKQASVLLGREVVVAGRGGGAGDGKEEGRSMGFEVTMLQERRRQYALALELYDPQRVEAGT